MKLYAPQSCDVSRCLQSCSLPVKYHVVQVRATMHVLYHTSPRLNPLNPITCFLHTEHLRYKELEYHKDDSDPHIASAIMTGIITQTCTNVGTSRLRPSRNAASSRAHHIKGWSSLSSRCGARMSPVGMSNIEHNAGNDTSGTLVAPQCCFLGLPKQIMSQCLCKPLVQLMSRHFKYAFRTFVSMTSRTEV
jgi:hypothetical protein